MPFPKVRLSSRPLHFIYICDCSGSMEAQGKMQALNQAIRQSLPSMSEVANENPEAKILVRVVCFADQAAWHLEDATPVQNLQWQDLEAGGTTAMGAALGLVASVLQSPPMDERALPPVLVLISDGQPTDDFEAGLSQLMHLPWAQKAVRLAIAMGHDADLEVLQQFIGPAPAGDERSGRRPLQASNATTLSQYLQWASTCVVGATSMPTTRLSPAGPESDANIRLPDLPPELNKSIDDVGPLMW